MTGQEKPRMTGRDKPRMTEWEKPRMTGREKRGMTESITREDCAEDAQNDRGMRAE